MDNQQMELLISSIVKEVLQQMGGGAVPGAGTQSTGASSVSLAKYIDHTLLKPDAARADILKVCAEAKKYNTASVCVNPAWIGLVAKELTGSTVTPCVVVGFPLGATLPAAKAAETSACISAGAKEIDMVMNVGAAKSGEWDVVLKDIEAVVAAARGRAIVKVILETCLLTDEEKVKACQVCKLAKADFVKTSTGFSTGGATVEDIRLMRATVGPAMGVKASGGVRTQEDAQAMIAAGASRIGASSSKSIVEGAGAEKRCVNCGNCRNGGSACPSGIAKLQKALY